jgi:hypothetical protein
MTASSPPRISVWVRHRSAIPVRTFAPALAFIVAVAAEFRRATAATKRYEQLRRTARACSDPEASPTRRVYLEFYSDS